MSRRMIPIVLVLMLVFVVIGCKTVQSYKDDYALCVSDPVCLAKMQNLSSNTRAVVSAIPVGEPVSNVFGQIAGMLASVLGGILYGKRLRTVRSTDK